MRARPLVVIAIATVIAGGVYTRFVPAGKATGSLGDRPRFERLSRRWVIGTGRQG
jgi:hypothetical protein